MPLGKAGKGFTHLRLLVVPLGKAGKGFTHLGVVDRWSATPQRARCSALMGFFVIGG